jgi:hypothetical protein
MLKIFPVTSKPSNPGRMMAPFLPAEKFIQIDLFEFSNDCPIENIIIYIVAIQLVMKQSSGISRARAR